MTIKKTEYAIFKKLGRTSWEYWDGGFKTLASATKAFNKGYRCQGRQDFCIVLITFEEQPIPPKPAGGS